MRERVSERENKGERWCIDCGVEESGHDSRGPYLAETHANL